MVESNIPPVGKEPMELVEYLGGQMNFTITGDSTGAKYTFGKDRPKGWVFKSDVGDRESKLGFLSKREGGRELYRIAKADKQANPDPTEGMEVTTDQTPVPVDDVVIGKHGAVGMSETVGTLTAAPATAVTEQKIATPNPIDLTVEELKSFVDRGLTKDQWEEVYRIEMANRNRKGLIAFLEELLANWSENAGMG